MAKQTFINVDKINIWCTECHCISNWFVVVFHRVYPLNMSQCIMVLVDRENGFYELFTVIDWRQVSWAIYHIDSSVSDSI